MSTGLRFDAAAARRIEKVDLTPDVVAQRAVVLGESGDYFFSLNRYLFLAEKPGAP